MWTFKDLRESLGLPGFQNLRKLSLPQWLVSWVPEGEWSAFAPERDIGFHFGRTTPYGCTPVGRTVIYY